MVYGLFGYSVTFPDTNFFCPKMRYSSCGFPQKLSKNPRLNRLSHFGHSVVQRTSDCNFFVLHNVTVSFSHHRCIGMPHQFRRISLRDIRLHPKVRAIEVSQLVQTIMLDSGTFKIVFQIIRNGSSFLFCRGIGNSKRIPIL